MGVGGWSGRMGERGGRGGGGWYGGFWLSTVGLTCNCVGEV